MKIDLIPSKINSGKEVIASQTSFNLLTILSKKDFKLEGREVIALTTF